MGLKGKFLFLIVEDPLPYNGSNFHAFWLGGSKTGDFGPFSAGFILSYFHLLA